MPTKKRPPQLTLRLDAQAPDPAARWRNGASLPYLGGRVTLCLDTHCKEARLDGDDLHLPLPPEATSRQVQDAAESWLRARALRVISAHVAMAARQFGRPMPEISLSFSARGGWAQADGDDGRGLRCHWRLVEQSPEVIAEVIAKAVASLPRRAASLDLFAVA